MKKLLLTICILLFFVQCSTRTDMANSRFAEILEIKKFQKELNEEYASRGKTPLRGSNYLNFKGHPFFPVNLKYRVKTKFSKTKNPQPFEIQTSSGNTRTYQKFGKATFQLSGKSHTLTLYQSLELLQNPEYQDYLFLPFHDETNGKETYGGGKYMDLKIPSGNEIILDFNKSYQPFCAYNAYDYSCPIVPEENRLQTRIEAGVMYNDVYHH